MGLRKAVGKVCCRFWLITFCSFTLREYSVYSLTLTGTSAFFTQLMPYNTGIEYMHLVNSFFYYALFYDMTVNQALDHATWQHWGDYFVNSPLTTGFTAVCPFYYNGQWNNHYRAGSRMAVYGNGNICLKA